MRHELLLYSLAAVLTLFYYIFNANPYGILSYIRIPLMILTLVVVFGVLIFIEYYWGHPVFAQDSLSEMGTNFWKYSMKYGFYLLYLSVIALVSYGMYKGIEAGFVFSFQYSMWVTMGLILIVLTLLNQFVNDKSFDSPTLDLIKTIVLYIPCLITDAIEYMKRDYANTPSTVFIVFAALVVYIVVFYLVPFYQKQAYKNDGILLIDKPMYLNRDPVSFTTLEMNQKILDSRPFYDRWFQEVAYKEFERSRVSAVTLETRPKPPEKEYVVPPDDITKAYYKESFTSLSNEDQQIIPYSLFKTRVEKDYQGSLPPDKNIQEYVMNHPQILTVREKLQYLSSMGYASWDALKYSLSGGHSFPAFQYHYALTAWVYFQEIQSKDLQLIYSFGSRPSLYYDPLHGALMVIIDYGRASQKTLYKSTSVLFQRWNFIVMNYNYGSLDLFINNNLVGTYPDVLTVLQPDDLLIVGSRSNKNIGGICNMKYYELPIGIRKINSIYQSFRNKKIPI